MKWTRTTVGIAIVSIAAGFIMAGCASAPRVKDYDGDVTNPVTREAYRCLQTGPCFVVQVQNDNYYDAVLYLNGSRFGYANGLSKTTLFIHDSQLRDGRCATVVVRLIGPGTVTSSTKECVREDEHYQLDIGPSSAITHLHVFLIPRR